MPLAVSEPRSVSRKLSARTGREIRRATPPEVEATVIFRKVPRGCGLDAGARRALRKFASRVNLELVAGRGFDCLITNDDALRDLNDRFLGHGFATDVLSFPSGAARGPAGELAISSERAAAQASEHGHSLLEEIQVLMLHGALHLAGHDHERDRGEMARLEQRWRIVYELPSGLIRRTGERKRRRNPAAKARLAR